MKSVRFDVSDDERFDGNRLSCLFVVSAGKLVSVNADTLFRCSAETPQQTDRRSEERQKTLFTAVKHDRVTNSCVRMFMLTLAC